MRKLIKNSNDRFGMTTLNPKKSGLDNIVIWSEHGGVTNVKHTPSVKLSIEDMSISVSISQKPEIIAKSESVTNYRISEFDKGIKYVAQNYDIFLRHYNDTSFEFDDEDLFQALRDRGQYK